MKILSLFLLLTICMVRVYSQSTLPLRADTVVIEKVGGNATLKVKDSSRNTVGGILTNIGGGVYTGKRPRISGDTLFIGTDTVLMSSGADSTIFSTNYRRDTAAANIRDEIGDKLNASDTTDQWINDMRRRPGTDTVEKFKNGSWQFAYVDSIKDRTVSKGVVLGNSTISAYIGYNGVHQYLMTTSDSTVGTTITNIAVPGHKILDQLAAWEADASKATYDWIIVEVGLNDTDPTEAAPVAIARLQRLIDSINSQKKVTAKVLISTMTPCKAKLIAVYGTTDGETAYQKWLDMNAAMMGSLPNKITGVDYRITNHTIALDDGDGNLRAAYNVGDGIHENNEGRKVIAHFWRNALNELGFLKVTQPTFYAQSPFYEVTDTIRSFNTGASMFLGNTINTFTTTPIRLNLGGTYGPLGDPRAGKLVVYDPGTGDSSLRISIGADPNGAAYFGATGHSFYTGGTSSNAIIRITKLSSGQGRLLFGGTGGFLSTAAPALIDMGGSVGNAFGDPTKMKILLYNNTGSYAGLGETFNGTSSQFEMHTYSNSSYANYINSVVKFRITDTSIVAPQLLSTDDEATWKPVVVNSSGQFKKFTSWPVGGNFANTDLTFNGNRTHNANSNSFALNNMNGMQLHSVGTVFSRTQYGLFRTIPSSFSSPLTIQYGMLTADGLSDSSVTKTTYNFDGYLTTASKTVGSPTISYHGVTNTNINIKPAVDLNIKATANDGSNIDSVFVPGPIIEVGGDDVTYTNPVYKVPLSALVPEKQSFSQTATVTVDNTTTETTLIGSGAGSLTIQPSEWVAGATYRIKVHGILGTDAVSPGTTNFRLKLGSTTIATTGGIFQGTNISGRNFEITTEFVCRTTGATGTVMTMGFYQDRNSAGNRMDDSGSGTPTTIDMTASQTLDFTLEWSQAAAGNTCSVYIIYFQRLN